MISIRIRSKTGVENLKVDSQLQIIDFQKIIDEKTSTKPEHQKILHGFPPKSLDLSNPNAPISNFLSNGDTITIENTTALTSPTPAPAVTLSSNSTSNKNNSNNKSEPYMSEEEVGNGFATRRITDDDNSCLFSAVAYVLEDKSRWKGGQLRQLIAQVVRSDPFEYNEGFLGKSNAGYCNWILNPNHWGGAIELSILSNHYKVEIAAFDISTQIMYCYGEDKNYTERVYLIYDGIHYDALSICLTRNGGEDFDITRFSVDDKESLNKLKKFVENEKKLGKYTDTTNFMLLCLDCNKTLKGEKEAAIHASLSGHGNFTEKK
ncbi:hypothetical protein DICPUDRAFT_88743 [Dictyostelium purpureum]|uniref:Ubiquitin thioesterase OTU n=1 Tax=Dictyostelium purpureum TaxID=5786 RepID=F0ZRC7_DICPU|nr:uncharacterized protein DICPUDRAFT_88743 [Dictyostelium purpureum]EGC33504.1 hypothetical protein DICPUDRAFT_88743 [Dictyostelium purpureum]|eukprot:XP_003289978.1 hypothetical protein DICPUDRAFT_88743 [Dictyostelium purpureum]